MAVKTYTVREGQSLFDLALQLYGDVTKVYEIIKLNPVSIPNIMARNLKGLTINYEVQNNEVANRYATEGTIISTLYPEYTTGASAWSSSFSSSFVSPSTS